MNILSVRLVSIFLPYSKLNLKIVLSLSVCLSVRLLAGWLVLVVVVLVAGGW